MARIPSTEMFSLSPFVYANVAPGTVVQTDGGGGYNQLLGLGYDHHRINLSREGSRRLQAHRELPEVHHVVALLKRWLLGTLHGAVSPSQLDFYLDEFTFRFNRRRARHVGLVFHRLLELAVITAPTTYGRIAGGADDRF